MNFDICLKGCLYHGFFKKNLGRNCLDHLAFNVKQIQKCLPKDTRMMGVVKADAYGHGDRYIAKEMENLGLQNFGVSNLEEALSLRESGVESDILILGRHPPLLPCKSCQITTLHRQFIL